MSIRFAIRDDRGFYWAARHHKWVESYKVATYYSAIDDLPLHIDDDIAGRLYLELTDDQTGGWYHTSIDRGNNTIANVVKVDA